MNVHSTRQLLTGAALALALAVLAACSGMSSSSMNPTAPSVGAASSGANFSPNPTPCSQPAPWVTDPADGDGCACLPPNIFDAGPPEACFPPKEPPPPPTGDQGCTPGYWKGNAKKGAGNWPAPYTTGSTLESVFDVPGSTYDNDTLLDALGYGGGSGVGGATQILLRAAAAALLNAQSSGVGYPLTAAQVISQVNTALASQNRDTILTLAGTLDANNNLGCPLDNSGSILR
jgi:hypothetical protein